MDILIKDLQRYRLETRITMFRLWGKILTKNKLIKDITIENPDMTLNRTRKVFQAMDQICYEFDLEHPIWLESNISEFQRFDKTRFFQDNFIGPIDFDCLEIHVIEED